MALFVAQRAQPDPSRMVLAGLLGKAQGRDCVLVELEAEVGSTDFDRGFLEVPSVIN